MNKEVKAITKEKTIILTILIQLLIASLSSIILVGLISFYDPSSIAQNSNIRIKMGVTGDTGSPLVSFMKERNIVVTPFSSEGLAEDALKNGSIDAFVYIPYETGVVDMKLYLPESDSRSTVIMMVLKEPLKKYENYLRENNGVHIRYTGISGRPSTTYEFLYTFIVPLLMLFPAFIAGSIVIDTLSEEFENHTLDTLLSTPLTLNDMLGAKLASAVFVAAAQCVLWPILLYFNHIRIQNMVLVLALAIILAALIAIISGIIAMYFKDRERSQFIYSIMLLIAGALAYFIDPSPFSLMARLAMGDSHVGAIDVAVYVVPLLMLLGAFFYISRRLIAVKA